MPEFYRKYYRVDLTLRSPLCIGSGENENTDKDVIVDGGGTPFIPATSLAGVIRSCICRKHGRAAANRIFGFIPASKEENERAKNRDEDYVERKSRIIVYDAVLQMAKEQPCFITSRDMVALENRVAADGAKFDMEAVEPGAQFTAYLELLTEDSCVDVYLEEALSAINAGVLRLGSKTTRGYGEVSLRVRTALFTDIDAWLEFDMMRDEAWDADGISAPVELSEKAGYEITAGLRQRGGISIREYTTQPGSGEETMPDYITLGLHSATDERGERIPVIPGTSWAGVFRDRYKEFAGEDAAKDLFGIVGQERQRSEDGQVEIHTAAKKSKIIFSESRLSGGAYRLVTRTAVNRFTGAVKNSALYTEKTYFDGETELKITFPEKPDEGVLALISACLADLHNGYMAVGGLTSVGRGLFEITSINGRTLSPEDRNPDTVFGVIAGVLKGDAENE